MHKFKAEIEIIGINPFVFVPDKILQQIFKQAGKDKGYIPIKGAINDKPYRQTLVKYGGGWRLYINTSMLKNSPKRLGEIIEVSVSLDTDKRETKPPENFVKALSQNVEAKAVFESLPASRKLEIVRYLGHLKTEDAIERNVKRAINFLSGKERFIGRERP